MGEQIRVWVEASDQVTGFGIRAQLCESAELELVDRRSVTADTVAILAVDQIDDRVRWWTAELGELGCSRYILVAPVLDDDQLPAGVDVRVCAVLNRADTTPATLERTVLRAVRGESELPTTLLTRLLRDVADGDTPARTLPRAGLTPRESQVLTLIADGLDTAEIAERLSYSARTVKNVVHAVTTRFCLRNRSHAVAYAVREGLI